jgi:hypothetical protein
MPDPGPGGTRAEREALLAAAPADDEPLTGEDRVAICVGLAEYAQGLATGFFDGGPLYSFRGLHDLGEVETWRGRIRAALVRLPPGDLRRVVDVDPPTWRLARGQRARALRQSRAGVRLVVRALRRPWA